MRSLRILGALAAVSLLADGALGQFGLYGAPEVLRLPQARQEAIPQYSPAYANDMAAVGPAGEPTPALAPIPEQGGPGPASPVQQMLREARPSNAGVAQGGPYGQVQSSTTWESRGCGATGECGTAESCQPACAVGCECPWYASANWLIMSRDKSNRVWTTYESGDQPDQLMHTWDMETKWSNGGEITFGRRFCCGQWALEGSYWTLAPMNGYSSMTNVNGVSTPLSVSDIEFDHINGVVYFDNAAEHRIWRDDEFHNVEINLVRYVPLGNACNPCGSCSPWDFSWAVGVRYFRFAENLRFGSLDNGYEWGEDDGEHEAYLGDKIRNNLIGAQLGCDVKYNFRGNLGLFLNPKFGVYNNHVSNEFQAYRGDGVDANPTAASGVTGTYPVESSGNFVSFMTEVNLGLNWQVTQNWSARIGYRVIAATGIGLADHQVPHYVVDIPEIKMIDHNGNLLVHGAFAGVTYNF
jgi:hypothetical protein